MSHAITLAVDVPAEAARVYEILSTAEGQRAFWTADCDMSADRARIGFPRTPTDLEVEVTTKPDTLVRMRVTSGASFWAGTSWEWELGPAALADTGTCVLFRHYGFADQFSEALRGHVTQTWAMITDRLTKYIATGRPQPYFPAE
jgi:uncharacterized protein YndB with AHSA1/START domain